MTTMTTPKPPAEAAHGQTDAPYPDDTNTHRLLAACGLYCGACYHYRASRPGGDHLLTDEARGGRPLAGYLCGGCRSEKHYIHPGCRDCEIRACADARGLRHCGACEQLPCEQLRAFQYNGRKHHLDVEANLQAVERRGAEGWLVIQALQWQCPSCDAPFSWYEITCHACGAPLPSYGIDD
jgi:hypothetical protein